jgi:superfamily II DNA or RNA helicase
MDSINLINAESPRSVQPDTIGLSLKPHQLASLYRMSMLDRECGITSNDISIHSNLAILADRAGYGKTITFLAMIAELKTSNVQSMPRSIIYQKGDYGITWNKNEKHKYINTTLIVIPNNLINHWQKHIEEYTELTYETIINSSYDKILVEDYDIIICPAKYYNSFVHYYHDYYWNRIAYEEADSIHIPNTQSANARFLWFITATYDNIPHRRNNGFIRDLFRSNAWVSPIERYFQPVIVKGNDEFVQKSFALIDPQIYYIDCVAPQYIQAVRNHITPKILELISAGDLDGAIISLGGNVDSDRNIFDLVSRNIKNNIISVQSKIEMLDKLQITREDKEKKTSKLNGRLYSLQTRLDSLEQSITDATNSDCIICCDILQHPTLTPCCNNMFCAQCLLKWLKDHEICPLCRGKINLASLHTIGNTKKSKSRKKEKTKTDKLHTIIDIIKKKPSGKYLLFSGYNATFRDIESLFAHEKISYGILTNSSRTENTLRKFKNGDLQVILLDAEHNGAGLEIQCATDVILFHQMRHSLEIQSIARAQRPGRSKQLRVWKLKYQHEYKNE